MRFVPAPGCVEVSPMKQEGIIQDPNQKYEEMGKILACGEDTHFDIGTVIAFDSYACRATTDMEGNKHYVVTVTDGGFLGTYVQG